MIDTKKKTITGPVISVGPKAAKPITVDRMPLSKFIQREGYVIDKYKKAYLEVHTRGVLRTADEWRDYLSRV